MGFIDLNGALGRRFGSIGLSLDRPMTRISVTGQKSITASGPECARVMQLAQAFSDKAGLTGGAHIEVLEAIPGHAGLGSGTQLALAVCTALARLYGLPLSISEIAGLTGRGRRSGIGIGAFAQGGLLVDGGRGTETAMPPILARLEFPAAWRVLLVFDHHSEGVHGTTELKAFGNLPEFPEIQAAQIARLLLMQALPAVAEKNLTQFGRAISTIQKMLGEHFAPEQGGGIYISQRVAAGMEWLEGKGVTCLGQSSWGPTGFAVLENESFANDLAQKLEKNFPHLDYQICQGRNEGAMVTMA